MKILISFCTVIILSPFSECQFSDSNRDRQAASNTNSGIYNLTQAKAGATLYSNYCANCHENDLRDTEGGTTLTGDRFIGKWVAKSV